MATPVVVVPAGGLPVTEALSPYGWPMIESPTGHGLPVTFSTGGIPVAGISAFIAGSPVNTVAPVISGTTTIGQVLSCTTGTWSPTATSYAYQWRRNGNSISGATASTYTLVAADNAAAITCRVVGTNAIGPSLGVVSNTLTLADARPVNSVAPVATGTATIGNTLSCSTGTWSNTPTAYAYEWRRDGVAISGATSATYLLVSADLGASVLCRVTASNAIGATPTPVNSNAMVIGVAGTTTVTAANGQWWKFPGTLENGLYVDGSPWVKTATTVPLIEVSAMPTGTGITARNGGMINPTFNTMVEGHPVPGGTYSATMKHGYDGRINTTNTNPAEYDAAYNAHASLPLTLSPGDSLVSCESFHPEMDWAGLLTIHPSNTRVIKRMACVTIVSTTPAADAFRPNYYGTTKISKRVSDMNLALLPDLTAPFNPKGVGGFDFHIDPASALYTGTSVYSYMTATEYTRVMGIYDLQYWIFPVHGEAGNAMPPNFQQDFHATSYGRFYGNLALYVMCDFADRDVFVKNIVQLAIDAYAIAAGFSGRSPFARGAGYFSSPLWFVRFAGLLFNDTPMKNAIGIATGKTDFYGAAFEKWGENAICYYSATSHAQYRRVSGEAYPLGFPLYGDQAHQAVPSSSTPGGISSNFSLRDSSGIYDSADYGINLPVAAYPDILDDTYIEWIVTNPADWGTYYQGHQCGVGVVLASIAMGDFDFWKTGNRAYGDWIKRRINDPQMWGGWGALFSYNDINTVGDANFEYRRDYYGYGGTGNLWMVQMGDVLIPRIVPTVVSFSPTDNATDVAITANLVVTFSTNVQFGTGSISIYKTDDTLVETFNVVSSSLVTISGAVLTINPTASLLNSQGYYVQIAATAIDSLGGGSFAGILDETTWSFTTVASGPVAAWTQIWARPLAGANPGWNGYTLVYVIPLANLSLPGGGTQIRLSIKGANADGTVMSALWVGNGGGGDPYDFTGDQVQMLQSGGTTITAGTSATVVTDGVNFVKDGVNSLVIAWQHTSGTGDDIATVATDGTSAYYATATQASLQNKSGYAPAGGPVAIAKVELFTTDYVEDSGAVENISEGASAVTGVTYIDRSWSIDNNMTITKLGYASVASGTCKIKIAKRVSAGSYDIVVSETFTHPGGGYKLKTLTTPYVVPSTGDFYVAMYDNEGSGTGWERWTSTRAHFSGDATGTGVAFTESTSNAPLTKAVGTR